MWEAIKEFIALIRDLIMGARASSAEKKITDAKKQAEVIDSAKDLEHEITSENPSRSRITDGFMRLHNAKRKRDG